MLSRVRTVSEPGPWTGVPALPAATIFSVSSSTSSPDQVLIGGERICY